MTKSISRILLPFRAWRRLAGPYAILALLLLILAAFLLYPVARMLLLAVAPPSPPSPSSSPTAAPHVSPLFWLTALLTDTRFLGKLANSLLLAAVVTLLCNLIAFPLALLHDRYRFRGKMLLGALVLVPLVLPPFVGAIGLRQILGKFGALTMLLQHLGILAPGQGINWLHAGGFWACAVLIALGLYPIAYLNLQAALANIDPALLEAARNLGARRFTVFRRITLPLAMPGVFAGSALIFIWAFTELGTPLMLDYPRVVSRDLFDDLASASAGNSPLISAKVSLVLVIAVLAYLAGKFSFGRRGHAMTTKATLAATPATLGLVPGLLAALPFLAVAFLAMLPHLGVLLTSITALALEKGAGPGPEGVYGWYRTILPTRYTLAGYAAVFQTPEILRSILNSLRYAAASTALDLVLGVAIAWILIRTRLLGRTLLDSLAMLPLAVPGLVLAFGYVMALWDLAPLLNTLLIAPLNFLLHLLGQAPLAPFRDQALVDSLRLHPFLVLMVAYSMRRLPYIVRSAAGGLEQTSVELEEAAANLGASPWRVLRTITLPLIMANLIAGALLTFSFAMLEVSDSLILAQHPPTYPITKMIYQLGTDTSGPDNVRNACALGVLAMALLVATILAAATLLGKRLGALFRI